MTKMFVDNQGSYTSSHQSSSCPSSSDSMSSFYSNSSWNTDISTPPSTRRTSLDSAHLENLSFSTASTPERFLGCDGLPVMSSSMLHEMGPGFSEQNMLFPMDNGKMLPDQGMMSFANFPTYSNTPYESFESNHRNPANTPSLEMDLYSPTSGMTPSPVSLDFVIPSQTTFMDTYDMNSPMRTVRQLQFDSPTSDYNSDFSLDYSSTRSVKYFMSPYNETKYEPRSASTTPSRPSTLRQHTFEPVQSSNALQRAQAASQAMRHTRKRMKRELMLPSNIRVQNKAKKECPWEGCNGKFQRQEHLKRHEKTHLNTESFDCQFCDKKFGRSDNLKSHIRLHADPNKKSSRTQHFPEAMKVFLEMNRKAKKSGDGGKRERDGTQVRIARSRDSEY